MRVRLSAAAMAAAFALGTSVAVGQPAALSAYLLPNETNPGFATITGTAIWQEVDFGTGPAIAVWLSFRDIGAEAMFVLQAAGGLFANYSHRYALVPAWPEGDVPGPVTDGRLLQPASALGVPLSRSVLAMLPVWRQGDIDLLVRGALDEIIERLAGAAGICGELVDYALVCFAVDARVHAILDPLVAAQAADRYPHPPVVYGRGTRLVAGARTAVFHSWELWYSEGTLVDVIAIRVRSADVVRDLALKLDAEGSRLTFIPPVEDGPTAPGTVTGLDGDEPLPGGVTLAVQPDGLRLSGDPVIIGAWLAGQEALTVTFSGPDGVSETLRLDLTETMRRFIEGEADYAAR
ncbi:MAG: hypothetical protein KIT43_10445 [Bauldia sp.]|nr:hypothetical protein [Bauldia sp.]